VSPQQQNPILIIDHCHSDDALHTDDVMFESLAIRQLHVDEHQVDPAALVQRTLTVDDPAGRRI